MRHITLLVVVLTVTPLTNISAQEYVAVTVGTRVRVTAPELDLDRYDGIVRAMDSDTLIVDSLWVALTSVTRLDVHRGTRGHPGWGALIGLPAGALIGATWAVAFSDATGDEAGIAFAGGLLFGTAGGLVVGIVVGSLIKSDRWEEISLDQLRVSFGPQRDGRLGLGLSVKF